MADPNQLMRAFNNMKLYTQDHLILSMRPELRQGVLEAMQIFEGELSKLKSERAELERKLGIFSRNARPPSLDETHRKTSGREQQSPQDPGPGVVKTSRIGELNKPTGPIDIGRPYPVYVICYVCDKRVLTRTTEKSSGGCCLSCLTETPPVTVLHSCPLCQTFLGVYYDRQEDED